MNHQEVLRSGIVERYLLRELDEPAREQFEEHLFGCALCAEDVKAGAIFTEALRDELRQDGKGAHERSAKPVWRGLWTKLVSPWVLGPTLASCLLLLLMETFVVIPRMRVELAKSETPTVLKNLLLANAGARGDALPQIAAPRNGAFILSVDIPTTREFETYRCILSGPSGGPIWQADIETGQAADTVLIHVPTARTSAGVNTLVVLAVKRSEARGEQLIETARYRFDLQIGPEIQQKN